MRLLHKPAGSDTIWLLSRSLHGTGCDKAATDSQHTNTIGHTPNTHIIQSIQAGPAPPGAQSIPQPHLHTSSPCPLLSLHPRHTQQQIVAKSQPHTAYTQRSSSCPTRGASDWQAGCVCVDCAGSLPTLWCVCPFDGHATSAPQNSHTSIHDHRRTHKV